MIARKGAMGISIGAFLCDNKKMLRSTAINEIRLLSSLNRTAETNICIKNLTLWAKEKTYARRERKAWCSFILGTFFVLE